jgi:hypothetical protein
MMNKVLVLKNHRGVMESKRKLVHQHQLGSGFRPRVRTSLAGPVFRPALLQLQPRPQSAGQGFSTLQCEVIQCSNNLQTPAAENQNVQRSQAA